MTALPRLFALSFAYFAGAFALGMVLGTARTLWLAPRVGDVPAVLAELPLMLGFSWWWASHLLRRRPLSGRDQALAMGAAAFALLLLAELALALLLGRSPGEWLASLTTPPAALGLAGQLGFAVMPNAVLRYRSSSV